MTAMISSGILSEVVTEGIAAPPAYFPENARINREGYQNINEILKRNRKPLSLKDFESAINEGALILDSRHEDLFEQGSLKNSINIPAIFLLFIKMSFGHFILVLQPNLLFIVSAIETPATPESKGNTSGLFNE